MIGAEEKEVAHWNISELLQKPLQATFGSVLLEFLRVRGKDCTESGTDEGLIPSHFTQNLVRLVKGSHIMYLPHNTMRY